MFIKSFTFFSIFADKQLFIQSLFTNVFGLLIVQPDYYFGRQRIFLKKKISSLEDCKRHQEQILLKKKKVLGE